MRRDELEPAISLIAERARAYLATLDDAPLHSQTFEETAWSFTARSPSMATARSTRSRG